MDCSTLIHPARTALAQGQISSQGRYVLYWMTAQRRLHSNFALQRAAEWSRQLHKPILIFEALRCDYPWASDRIHRFILEGMLDNMHAAQQAQVTYFPWVERQKTDGKGLLEALAKEACVVITDHYPAFFLPRMVQAAAKKLHLRLESIDSNCITPLALHGRHFPTAHSLRRYLQKNLRPHLQNFPDPEPLASAWTEHQLLLDRDTFQGPWAPLAQAELKDLDSLLTTLPIDHSVRPVPEVPGGPLEAQDRLNTFLEQGLARYGEDRNQPTAHVTTGLSPHLHFGHISPFEIVRALLEQEDWSLDRLSESTKGSREGWWGVSPQAEAFLDQVVTWRSLGFNTCQYLEGYDRYESLPEWARSTLEAHEDDAREHTYTLAQFNDARTHDPLWNAAQRQLVAQGYIHNYMRMLWGKKILEWSPTPRDALHTMIELNNRYGLDGRDPNSYSGIFWVLGRHDRAFGPERPVLGKVRYMSSENTARKLRIKPYLHRWGR